MSQARLLEPDLQFIREVKASGGDTVKKCFQCATCSVVCNLSPDQTPFPRKEMLWTQWGLKERLVHDPDVWLCHQCNDCSKYCPRGARPGDVLAALRRMTIMANAVPSAVARMVNEPRMLPVALGIPAALLLMFMAAAGTLGIPSGEIIYRKFIPQWPVVDVLFPLTALWAVVCSAAGVKKLWDAYSAAGPRINRDYRYSLLEWVTVFIAPAIVDLLKHSKFRECTVNRPRYFSHFNMVWGFILLAITTACVAAGVYVFGYQTPYSLGNPVKWIGNIGAVILIAGSFWALRNRYKQGDEAGKSTYFDWVFLWMVFATGVSGLLTELLRLANVPWVAYPMYFAHLVCVWFLFAYLPFSKFAHLLYRTTALVYARTIGRELKTGAAGVARPRASRQEEAGQGHH
jgi:quinone-modifying oxidoreductase subunit QmoC